MSNYYKLDHLFEKGDLYIEDFDDSAGYGINCDRGEHIDIPEKHEKLICKYKTARKTDFVSGIHFFPIISGSFKSLLEALNTDPVEFHPVQLVSQKTNELDKSYFFMNVLDNIECFDKKESKYTTYPETDIVRKVNKLVIENEAVKSRNIFRISEIPTFLFVSSELKEQVTRMNLIGFKFLPVEDFKLI